MVLAKSGLGPIDLDEIIGEDRTAMVHDLIRCCEAPSDKVANPSFLSSLCAQIGTQQALSILQTRALGAVRESLQEPPQGAQQAAGLEQTRYVVRREDGSVARIRTSNDRFLRGQHIERDGSRINASAE